VIADEDSEVLDEGYEKNGSKAYMGVVN